MTGENGDNKSSNSTGSTSGGPKNNNNSNGNGNGNSNGNQQGNHTTIFKTSQMSEFSPETQRFDEWLERLEIYFIEFHRQQRHSPSCARYSRYIFCHPSYFTESDYIFTPHSRAQTKLFHIGMLE